MEFGIACISFLLDGLLICRGDKMGGKIALTYSGLPPLLLREASLLFALLRWFEKRKPRVVQSILILDQILESNEEMN